MTERAADHWQQDYPQECAMLLRRMTLPAAPRRLHPGRNGKWLVELQRKAGFIKLAVLPQAVAVLRHEAASYAEAPAATEYRQPRCRILQDGGNWLALWLEAVPVEPLSRLQALRRRAGPFEAIESISLPLGTLLPEMALDGSAARMRAHLLSRLGDKAVPAGPSHGDFVYWNLGRLETGGLAMFDLERFAMRRSRYFDRIMWNLAPLARQAARRPLFAALLLSQADRLAAWLKPASREDIALMLAGHAAILSGEEPMLSAEPEIARLVAGQVEFYERLLPRLLP